MIQLDKDKKSPAIISWIAIVLVFIIVIITLIWHFAFNKEQKVEENKPNVETQTTQTSQNNTQTQELPSWENSITQPANNLSDISKTVQEEQEKKLAEENARIEEFTKILNQYIEAVNWDKDILSFIAEDSLKKIKEITQKRYSAFSDTDKAEFVKDLQQLGYPNSSFDASKDADLNLYINFIIKWGLKVDGKIVELKDVSWKFDSSTNTFCGRFSLQYDGGKTKSIDSLCINKDKKFLIHSVN